MMMMMRIAMKEAVRRRMISVAFIRRNGLVIE
jgi:hypothetical protein